MMPAPTTIPPTTIPPTTTTIDPTAAIPLLQRTYNTRNNGIGEPVVMFLFVVVIVFAVVTGYFVGRFGISRGRAAA
jgi:hypothetical protein